MEERFLEKRASEVIPNNIEGLVLAPEQWQLVENLAGSLSPAQLQWLSGFFAGLAANRAAAPAGTDVVAPASAPAARKLTILYGTETGNSTEVAQALGNSAKEQGLAPTVADMADYKPRQLGDEEDLLIVVSTYGEGDPPQPSTGFFEFVEGPRAPKLEGVRYAVLALGDSTYEYYCEAGKRLDSRLEELGAKRLADRVDCDVDYDDPAAEWSKAIIEQLASEKASTAAVAASPSAATAAAPAASYDKRNPFPATIIENITIVGRDSTKETRHVELDLTDAGLAYEPGDALGICAVNSPDTVAELLDTLAVTPDSKVEHKGEKLPLMQALQDHYEITLTTPRFLEYWAELSGSDVLKKLCEDDRKSERSAFLHTHHIADIICHYPVKGVEPQDFLTALRPLQPRLYSIASSQAMVEDEVHLCVAPVRYELHGSPRHGVASGMLADRAEAGDTIPVYVQSNPHFRLPSDDAPIIMIGAGTGVAPYRAFLQEREMRDNGGKSWLFFGERNFRTDFLYQTEWQSWLKDGVLSRMDVAFSRDGADKVYVQHRMKEQAADLYAWLEEGAHVYVCGDANHLAPDVHASLVDVIASEARIGQEAAEDYIRSLQADRRYQLDVY